MILGLHEFQETLSGAQNWLLHAGLTGFLVTTLLALLGLMSRRVFRPIVTEVVGVLSSLIMWAYFISRFSQGVDPLANGFEVVILTSLAALTAYQITLVFRSWTSLGAWIHPIAFVMMSTSLLLGDAGGPGSVSVEERSRLAEDPWLLMHIVSMVVSMALFAFAVVISMVYLLQDRTLRRKRDSRILRSLPALDALSRVTSNIMLAGLPMLTLSLILGALSIREPLAEWVSHPFVISSFAMWLVFAIAGVGRMTQGLSGRRAAWLVVTGFGLVFITVFGTGQMPGPHTLTPDAGNPGAEGTDPGDAK